MNQKIQAFAEILVLSQLTANKLTANIKVSWCSVGLQLVVVDLKFERHE